MEKENIYFGNHFYERGSQMRFFKKKNPTLIYTSYFKLINGIPGWAEDIFIIRAELHDDRIIFFQAPIGKCKSTSLLLDQIIDTNDFKDEVRVKRKRVMRNFYRISYKSSAGNFESILLGCDCLGCGRYVFDTELRKRTFIQERPKG